MSNVMKEISNLVYKAYEKKLLAEVQKDMMPQHIAIIMDGNRRFAQEIGLKPIEGHRLGRNKLEEVLEWCRQLRIKIVTAYAFSSENILREQEEVNALMKLFAKSIREAGDDERIHKHKTKIKVIGQRDILPKYLQDAIKYAEERTKHYDNYFFNIAIAYGGREDILQAVRKIVKDVKYDKIKVDDIDEKIVSSHLYTNAFPDPDIILRTSGEERISNFLLWQMAYSDLYFADIYWPAFRKIDILRAIRAYQQRNRQLDRGCVN